MEFTWWLGDGISRSKAVRNLCDGSVACRSLGVWVCFVVLPSFCLMAAKALTPCVGLLSLSTCCQDAQFDHSDHTEVFIRMMIQVPALVVSLCFVFCFLMNVTVHWTMYRSSTSLLLWPLQHWPLCESLLLQGYNLALVRAAIH